MYYVYILKDQVGKLYVGYSSDLKQRLRSHRQGSTYTTARMDTPTLIYYEACTEENLARQREAKLKRYGPSYTGLLKRLGLK